MALKAFINSNVIELDDGLSKIVYIPRSSFDFEDNGGIFTLFNKDKKEESRSAAFGDIQNSVGTPIGTRAQVITLLAGFSPAVGARQPKNLES